MKRAMWIVIVLTLSGVPVRAEATRCAGRPDLVEKVRLGELKEARASWWGFDAADSTTNLQAAISSRVPRLVIDCQASPWITTPLQGVSNQELVFEKGAVLLAKRGAFQGKGECLLKYAACENVKIHGYGGTLRMWHEDYMKEPYSKSEWRHALSLLSCRNVTVEGLRIEGSGGDGIYLGSCRKPRCKNLDVVIRDVVCDNNHRQGISVISAENLLIENTVLSNTHGTPPAAGIDFEPNHPEEFLKNCVMRNCRAIDNQGAGFFTYAGQLKLESEPIDIRFENCTAIGNRTSFGFSADSRRGRPVGGVVTLRGCRFERPRGSAVSINETRFGNLRFDIESSTIVTTNAAGAEVVTPMDAAWKTAKLPMQNDPDFKLPRGFQTDLASAKIVDGAPGKMIALQPMRIRGHGEYIVYADSARTLHFTGHQVRVGRHSPSAKPIVVADLNAKCLAKLVVPQCKDAPLEFKAPAAGFYRLKFDVAPGSWVMTGSDAPIALDVSEGMQGFIASSGSLWFQVPEEVARLVFYARGEGTEKVHARLSSPSGKCEWERDNISNWAKANLVKPVSGLWCISSLRASEGCFEDFKYDLVGVPGFLFLSPDKYWLVSAKPAETWRVHELSFETNKDFSLGGGDALDLRVRFTSTAGLCLERPAFWDGGNVFRVRWAPPASGRWEWQVVAGKEMVKTATAGVIDVVKYSGKLELYRRGFVKPKAGAKCFVYADGTPFFYLGDTHWGMYSEEIDEPGPNAGQTGAKSHFKYIVNRRAEQGFTVYQSEPIAGKFDLRDGRVDASDIPGFQLADRYYQAIADAGLVHANAEFFFAAAMNQKLADDAVALERISRYWVARFGAYPVMWTLAQEVDNDFYRERGDQKFYDYTCNPWVKVAEFIHRHDCYQHPLSAHQENTYCTTVTGAGTSGKSSGRGVSAFVNEQVAARTGHNWWAVQWQPPLAGEINWAVPRDYWASPRAAVLYEGRYCYLWTKDFGARAQGWIGLLNGFCGYGYGAIDIWLYQSKYDTKSTSHDGVDHITPADKARPWSEALEFPSAHQMGYMRKFFERLPWWKLEPDLGRHQIFTPNPGCLYSAAKVDQSTFVAYCFGKSLATGTLHGLARDGKYSLRWFNPRTGEQGKAITLAVNASGNAALPEKPDTQDWVALVSEESA